MNYTEMEAKVCRRASTKFQAIGSNKRPQVREATNNEPWGCPTSTMQEIANATFN